MTDTEFPRDADGDALRRLVAMGADIGKEMAIDFAVAVPDESAGRAIALKAEALGYEADLVLDPGEPGVEDDQPSWTCYCTRTMIPTCESIVREQALLGEISAEQGGYPDGWGSFGNTGDK